MKEKHRKFWYPFLLFVAVIVLFVSAMAFLSLIPSLTEKIAFGESKSGFCESEGGTYSDALFSQDKCYVDGIAYDIYYDNLNSELRLAQ